MQKYKIMFGSKPISDSEIDQYKNFDVLLAKKVANERQHRMNKWIYGSIGALIGFTLIGYLSWQNSQDPKSNTSFNNRRKPLMEQSVVESGSEKIVIPSKAENKTIVPDVGRKASNLPSKVNSPSNAENETEEAIVTEFTEAVPICGYEKLYEYLRENCNYPDSLKDKKITGAVLVQFTISKHGRAEGINVVKRLHPVLDKEAVRVVSQMPLWSPARMGDKPIDTKLILPLTFQTK
jgi:periplasmic protein TonB